MKRKHRRLTRHKPGTATSHRVKAQTKTVVQKLKHDLSAPHASSKDRKAVMHSVTELRRTLHAVRQDVERNGAGRRTSLVKSALGDLDQYLATMAHGFTVSDPHTKLQLLARAQHSLNQAEHKAKRAGDDWPL